MLKNSREQYGVIAKSMHWLMALLFIGMFIIAYIMINISKSDFRMSLYDVHKATGMLLFALVAARLAWRFINIQPSLPTATPRWQRKLASANILGLYFIMITMPLTGFLTSTLGGHIISFYGIFHIAPLGSSHAISQLFANAHEWLSYAMLVLFGFHLTASGFHHFVKKDDVFTKIWFNRIEPARHV